VAYRSTPRAKQDNPTSVKLSPNSTPSFRLSKYEPGDPKIIARACRLEPPQFCAMVRAPVRHRLSCGRSIEQALYDELDLLVWRYLYEVESVDIPSCFAWISIFDILYV
jgi:hypothetical protein